MSAFKSRIFLLSSLRESRKNEISMLLGKQIDILSLSVDQMIPSFLEQNPCELIYVELGAGTSSPEWDAIRRLRIEQSNQDCPAIILATPELTKDSVDQALEAGFDLVLPSDLSPPILYAQLQGALQLSQHKRDLADSLEKLRRTHERLKKVSVFDELTGLHNARSIRRILRAEFKRAERYSSHLSVLCLDIDNFRQINEAHNHLMGSYILSKVGLQINGSIRGDLDFAARIGGDEFLLILPETDLDGAHVVAERILNRIRETTFDNGTHRVQVRMSIGIAHFDGEHGSSSITDPDILQRIAEHELNLAKQARPKPMAFIQEKSA